MIEPGALEPGGDVRRSPRPAWAAPYPKRTRGRIVTPPRAAIRSCSPSCCIELRESGRRPRSGCRRAAWPPSASQRRSSFASGASEPRGGAARAGDLRPRGVRRSRDRRAARGTRWSRGRSAGGRARAGGDPGAAAMPSQPLRFVHPLVRSAIYEELPWSERAVLHARAAQLLQRGRPGPRRGGDAPPAQRPGRPRGDGGSAPGRRARRAGPRRA